MSSDFTKNNPDILQGVVIPSPPKYDLIEDYRTFKRRIDKRIGKIDRTLTRVEYPNRETQVR